MTRSSSPLRFVVLHHTEIAQPHFDLMLESAPGSKLASWRCAHWPPEKDEIFTPIGDHRRDYLEYEGPVSEARGNVRRVAGGAIESLEIQPQSWRVHFPRGLKLILPR